MKNLRVTSPHPSVDVGSPDAVAAAVRRPRARVLAALVPLVTASAILGASPAALAEESSPAEPQGVQVSAAAASPVPTSAWYGWQTLTADGASTALVAIAGAAHTATPNVAYVGIVGVSGFALGGPIIHGAHGHWGLAAADLGLRVGAVALGGLVGAAAGDSSKPASCSATFLDCFGDSRGGLIVGASIGALAASILDAALLARERSAPQEGPTPAFSWTPAAGMVRGGGTAGVTGTF